MCSVEPSISPDKSAAPGRDGHRQVASLLGVRTAVTDTNGGYIFKGLPSGDYKVSFELSGFGTVRRRT